MFHNTIWVFPMEQDSYYRVASWHNILKPNNQRGNPAYFASQHLTQLPEPCTSSAYIALGLSHSNWWATHQNHSSLSFIYKSKAKGHPCLTPLSRWICSVHPLLVQTTDCTWLYMLSTMVHIISKLDNFFHTITCNTFKAFLKSMK